MQRYSVFDLLTLTPLLSIAYLQDFSLRSTSSLVSSQITISSANSIDHGGSLLTSSVSLSIIIANRNGLNADPWCSPILSLKLSVVCTCRYFYKKFVEIFTIFISYFVSCFLCLFLFFYALLNFLIPPLCFPVSFSFPKCHIFSCFS